MRRGRGEEGGKGRGEKGIRVMSEVERRGRTRRKRGEIR
jgi:hypothetical protein